MQFDEVILDSCKSIASATSALVKAASSAQRELVAAGKVRKLLMILNYCRGPFINNIYLQ